MQRDGASAMEMHSVSFQCGAQENSRWAAKECCGGELCELLAHQAGNPRLLLVHDLSGPCSLIFPFASKVWRRSATSLRCRPLAVSWGPTLRSSL